MTFSVLELAELLGVSKPTVSRAIKELEQQDQIKVDRQGQEGSSNKKILLSDDDVIKIIKLIKPTDYEQIVSKNRKISEYLASKAENSETRANQSNAEEQQSDTKQNKTQQSETLVIDILRQELENKQKTIDSLMEQNKMLITSNAYLSKLLEDKGEPQDQKDQTVEEGEFTELKEDQTKEDQQAAVQEQSDQTDQQPHKKTLRERFKAFFS